ncbi:hypothetical protein BaRGS_00010408, partial [Batillaria attramentaria]
EGLGCFKCTSINHSNPECEDTFNNTDRFWEPDCWGTRKNRMGSFPGTQCIKMIAEDEVVLRACVLEKDLPRGRQIELGFPSLLGKQMTKLLAMTEQLAKFGSSSAATRVPAMFAYKESRFPVGVLFYLEGFAVVVRNCVVDDGGTNSETEIGRLTHCGWMRTIKYLGKRMSGCILACDTDGCNSASLPVIDALVVLVCGVVSLLVTSGLAA